MLGVRSQAREVRLVFLRLLFVPESERLTLRITGEYKYGYLADVPGSPAHLVVTRALPGKSSEV